MVRTIVCDLDGSLMNPSSGIYVNEAVKEALIEVEKRDVLVVLNSARCFQGVYPLSKQILMQDFGGYVISCNGAHCFDVKMKKTMFEYVISNNDVSFIWQYAQKHNLGVGYSQPDYFVANKMTHGFELDMHNCDVDYILTNHMEKYLKGSVWKVSISDSKSRIDSIDAPVLEASGLGVTLENGCEACKKVAKKIVPSCYEDGCIEWLKEL